MHHGDLAVTTLLREAADVGAALPCANNPQLWFSERPADLELAKLGCRSCPLRKSCLAGAVDRGEPCGVWGGEIIQHGRILATKRPPGRPPKTREPCLQLRQAPRTRKPVPAQPTGARAARLELQPG